MDILKLFDDVAVEHIPAGTTIFAEGDPGREMYVVLDGEVSVSSDGVALAPLRKGDLFGEMSLIDDSPRSADARAVTDCRLAAVDERQFLFLVNEMPMFALHVMGVMAERLRG